MRTEVTGLLRDGDRVTGIERLLHHLPTGTAGGTEHCELHRLSSRYAHQVIITY